MNKLLPLALVGLLAACDAHQYYSPDQRYGLEAGMTEDEVVTLMGEPYEKKVTIQGDTVWIYEGKMSTGQFNEPRDPFKITVTMVDGRATKVVHDNEMEGHRVR